MSAAALDGLNVGNLLASQLAHATAAQVSGLSAANFNKLAPSLTSLGTAALAGVTLAEAESLTAAQVNALTATQVAAFAGAAATYMKDFQGVYAQLTKAAGSGALSTFAAAEALLQAVASGGSSAGKFAALTTSPTP